MSPRRQASCPLCGARMQADELLDACGELIETSLGVLSARCPHCQGYLEVLPGPGRVDVGYLVNDRFDVVITLPRDGLSVTRSGEHRGLVLAVPGHCWTFDE